jgi:hypothetical protein
VVARVKSLLGGCRLHQQEKGKQCNLNFFHGI